MAERMDPVVIGRDFAGIPNLVTEINRVIDATEGNAYRDMLMQAECNIELLQQILDTNRFTDDERTSLNQIASCLLDCRRRLNQAVERTGPTRPRSVNAVADDARFCCSPEASRSGPGRPRYNVTQNQIESQRNIHRNWSDIARLLGVSRTTLYRRRKHFGVSTDRRSNYSTITDDELDATVREILRISPNAGECIITGGLRARSLKVQRARLRQSIRRVDPIGREWRRSRPIERRVYEIGCPNEVWHIDGNHKLIDWRFVIHGAIDGYSRLIPYLHCTTNNTSATVLQLFRAATQQYGIPSRVRSDLGVENRDVARFMIEARGTDRSSIMTGESVHNQRIERLWCEVNQRVNSRFRAEFFALEREGLLNILNELDIYCLHLAYLDGINEALTEFVSQYNHHSLSTEYYDTPLQRWHSGTLASFWSDAVGAQSILSEDSIVEQQSNDDMNDEARETNDNPVIVPRAHIELSDEEMASLDDAVMNVSEHDHRGRYLAARNALLELFIES